jgi:synaptobrevin family protein YKT6
LTPFHHDILDGILIYANPPGAPAVPLVAAWDLESFGWLQRGTVQDVMAFMSKVSQDRVSVL